MKNITDIVKVKEIRCDSCDNIGYFCWTPLGGEFVTCPLCENPDAWYESEYTDKEIFFIDAINGNRQQVYPYCAHCKIIFYNGCIHGVNGCTDNCYNGHLISKWKNLKTNEIFNGMPKFESIEEWYNNLENFEILDWKCLGTNKFCEKAYYPFAKNPEYYKGRECKYQKT